jgi:hypothetical protein
MTFTVDEGDGTTEPGDEEDTTFMTINGVATSVGAGTIEFERIGNFEMGLSSSNGTTGAGFIDLYEDEDEAGSNYARIQAPVLVSTYTLTLPTTDGNANEILKTDGSGGLSWTTAGTATAWDDITDPDNNGRKTITFDNAAEATTFSSAYDTAGSFFVIDNTDADHANNTYLLDLDYSADDGDVDADYIKAQDSGGVVFTLQQDGDIATTGTVDVTDTTEASAIGTAAVTIDGGASIAKDLWLGDDFVLDSDDVVISLGDGQDVTITHDPDDGIFLKSTATTDDNPIILTMQTGETDINLDDALGGIYFQAPDEGTGTDAILVAAGIEAVSVGEFGAASNATKLSFLTANSEVAAEKASLDQAGNFTSSGDINVTGGDVKLGADPADAGADPADAGIGLRLSNGNVIAWEDAAEVTITHVDDSGLLLNSTHYLSFGDAGTYINQGTDGDLDLVADTNVEITVSDEDLTFADGGTNLVTIGTNTGVTEINTTLQFVTTGDIMGGINIHTDTANYVVETDDTSESYGTLFINGDNDAQTWTLPTAVAGKSMCFMQGQGVTAAITVTPGASDYLVVDSVRGTAATAYTSSGDGGDKICVVAVSADDWIVTSIQGTWSE